MTKHALVVGASGIVGSAVTDRLRADGWSVFGLARNPPAAEEGFIPVSADLLDSRATAAALATLAPSHVFITTWTRMPTEAENITANSAMVRNVLDALSQGRSVTHTALVTGLKHYLGPFDAYAKSGTLPETPLREEQPRLDLPNFYYAQEDEVYAAAARDGFTWSIHRPHTVIGMAVGNAMNMGTTLAVYASICRATGRPFAFPGSEAQWEGLSDVTDARLLAKQLVWAADTEAAHDGTFNVANGDVFRWKWLWPRLARFFGVESAPFSGTITPLEAAMADDAPIWAKIADEHQLAEPALKRLASAWHTDLDLGRPLEVMTDMTNSRRLGFTAYQSTEQSFLDLFNQLRAARLIP